MTLRSKPPKTAPKKTAPRRVLRVALVLGDEVIDERLIAAGQPVTIGQSTENTIGVALEALPRSWTLFDRGDGGYRLRLGAGMDGVLDDGGRQLDFDELRARFDDGVIPLSDDARGKLTLGEVTVLFQLVDQAPKPRREALPKSLRFGRMDRRLGAIVAGSIVLHTGIALAAWMHDRPVPRSQFIGASAQVMPDMVDLLSALPFDPSDPSAPTDPTAPPTAAPTPTPQVAKVAPTPAGPATRHRTPGPRGPDTSLSDYEEYLRTMHASSPIDMTGPDAPLPDPDDHDVTFGNPDRGTRDRGPAGPGDGTPTGPDMPDIQGPDRPVSIEPPPFVPPHEPVVPIVVPQDYIDEVIQKIRTTYMAGLERCHRRLLLTDPSAASVSVGLRLTIESDGKVGAHSATADDAKLDQCVTDLMANWSFRKPPDKEANLSVKLALQGSE